MPSGPVPRWSNMTSRYSRSTAGCTLRCMVEQERYAGLTRAAGEQQEYAAGRVDVVGGD